MTASDDSDDPITESYQRFGERWRRDKYRGWMPGNLISDFERERIWIALLHRHDLMPLDGRRIFDVGCGEGKVLLRFHSYGAMLQDLAGIDIIAANIESGRHRAPGVDLRHGDAARLDDPDGSFDIVTTSMAFSSMPSDQMRVDVAREMVRVLKPGGAILWYDFFVNPKNRETTPMRLGAVRELFPGAVVDAERVTLAPPLARVIAKRSWPLAELIGGLPFLRTHWAALIRPGQPTGAGDSFPHTS